MITSKSENTTAEEVVQDLEELGWQKSTSSGRQAIEAVDGEVVFVSADGQRVAFKPAYLVRLYNLDDEYVDTCVGMDDVFTDVMDALLDRGGLEDVERIIATIEGEAMAWKKKTIIDRSAYRIIDT